MLLTRYMKRTGKVWLSVYFQIYLYQKNQLRLEWGKVKGNPEFWACRVKPGRIIFEVDGVR